MSSKCLTVGFINDPLKGWEYTSVSKPPYSIFTSAVLQ